MITNIAKALCAIGLLVVGCMFFPLAAITQQQASPGIAETQVMGSSMEQENTKPPIVRIMPVSQTAYLLDDSTLTQTDDTNKPVFDLYTVSERKIRNLPLALPELSPFYGEKVAYVTLDDGPYLHTSTILDILKENEIRATFFVLGVQIEKYPEILKRIYAEGHAIGNHSYNHVYRELYVSPAAYLGQLQQTDDLIKKIIGVRPRITRAPGGTVGHFNREYWNALKNNGYVDIGWNISAGDASNANAKQIIASVRYQLENRALWNRAIILMHDGPSHAETVKALPSIIEHLKKEGFQFRVVDLRTPPAW